eukprot:2936443-Pleurochrysis_carterae.AAC.1
MLLLHWNSGLHSETIFEAPIEPPLAAAWQTLTPPLPLECALCSRASLAVRLAARTLCLATKAAETSLEKASVHI